MPEEYFDEEMETIEDRVAEIDALEKNAPEEKHDVQSKIDISDYIDFSETPDESIIGLEAITFTKNGKPVKGKITGYYYSGEWLFQESGSTLSKKVEKILVRKNI